MPCLGIQCLEAFLENFLGAFCRVVLHQFGHLYCRGHAPNDELRDVVPDGTVAVEDAKASSRLAILRDVWNCDKGVLQDSHQQVKGMVNSEATKSHVQGAQNPIRRSEHLIDLLDSIGLVPGLTQ